MLSEIKIGNFSISESSPCFIIAEAGVNHNGNLEEAFKLIDAASEAGADAVKFQTFKADKLVLEDAPKADYQLKTTSAEESQKDMLRKLELQAADFSKINEYAKERNILMLSTPFDLDSADLLTEIGVPAFKMSSGDLVNIPLLKKVKATGLPVILSTGMSTMGEIEKALEVFGDIKANQVILLQCTTNYPIKPEEANVRVMNTYKQAFGVHVGFSDHTAVIESALAAVALGARVVEKHFTLDRSLPGPDHRASLEPYELAQMVQSIRRVEASLGSSEKQLNSIELENKKVARRSLVSGKDIAKGEIFDERNIVLMRPGSGIPGDLFDRVIGKAASRDIPAQKMIEWLDID
jgi:N-acetylneuraminate synthase/N,N'-diacetyllegionaminate synthase